MLSHFVRDYCKEQVSCRLPDPDITAAEIIEDLQAALAHFAEIAFDQ